LESERLMTSPQSTYSLAFFPDELTLLDEAFSYLSHVVAAPSNPTTSLLGPAHVETVIQILDRWPESQRFPGTSYLSAA
jgi:phospholipase A-2-activating protein